MKYFLNNLYDIFLFDRKTMGFTFFVPTLMFSFSLFLILFVTREPSDIYSNIIIIQGVYIPFSCWRLMYRMSEMYEEGAQETLVPYYSNRFIYDFFRNFVVHLFGVSFLCFIFVLKYELSSLLIINMVHFVIILLFYMFLGTTLIVLIKNIVISLTIILIYTVLEVVTLGEFMPWPHIFLFTLPVWDPILSVKFMILSVTVITLISITTIFIKKTDLKTN